jgi:bis(5'-nucleosidyl)-tetraphosphatase
MVQDLSFNKYKTKMLMSNMEKDESFGIIPILRQDDTYLYLLVQHRAGHWAFPKGHAHPGESALQAACRELVEETGITDYKLLEGVSFSEHYTFTRKGQAFDKTVIYFPAWVESATVQCQPEEIQNYTWTNYEGAIALITFDASKQLLTDVNRYLTSTPA